MYFDKGIRNEIRTIGSGDFVLVEHSFKCDAAVGVPVVETSGLTEDGLQQIKLYLQEAKTVALIESSDVGKLTL